MNELMDFEFIPKNFGCVLNQ